MESVLSGRWGLGAALYALLARVLPAASDGAMEREDVSARAERLLTQYGDAVLRLAYSYLHNREDAEEVVQDTLVQLLKTDPELQGPDHEKAWLLRVAGNLAKNRLRSDRFVWEAVRSLPTAYREVIHLFYYEGYPTAQIAKILGKNESTVRSCLTRGRAQLRTILKEAYDFG